VLVLAVTILLAVLSVATFPCWSHSARWGYAPSVITAALLLWVATVVVGSRYAPKAAEAEIAMATIAPTHGGHSTYRHTVDGVIVTPDSTRR
jgi:hypothetical protein